MFSSLLSVKHAVISFVRLCFFAGKAVSMLICLPFDMFSLISLKIHPAIFFCSMMLLFSAIHFSLSS